MKEMDSLMQEQWAYRSLHSMDVTKGIAEATLAAADGWELISVLAPTEMVGYLFILKRHAALAA
jgi:hypothetical protein